MFSNPHVMIILGLAPRQLAFKFKDRNELAPRSWMLKHKELNEAGREIGREQAL